MIDVNDVPVFIGILITVIQLLLIVITFVKIYKIIKKRNKLEKNNEKLPGMYTFSVWFVSFFYYSGVVSIILLIDIVAFDIVNTMYT